MSLLLAFQTPPVSTPNVTPSVYPEAVRRPQTLAALQQALTGLSPRPEERIQLDWAPRYPSRVWRPTFRASLHQTLAPSYQPERTASLASVSYPDTVLRPTFASARQHAVSEIYPSPERTSSVAVTLYPDSVRRPDYQTSNQQPLTVVPPKPEKTSTLATAVAPDTVTRALSLVYQQQSSTTYPFPVPVVVVFTFFQAIYPDKLERVQQKETHVATWMKPEEKIQLDWEPLFQDRIQRATYLMSNQQVVAFASQPERTSPLASALFQDRAPRPVYLTAQQQTLTTIPVKPEESVQLDWQPAYVDRPIRIVFATGNQQSNALNPQPERSTPLASSHYVDRTIRNTFRTDQQQTTTTVPPKPEDSIQLDWSPRYVERVTRPFFAANMQQSNAFYPKPEERIQLDWWPLSVDRARRQSFDVSEQQVTAFHPKPEERIQLDWEPTYPSKVDGVYFTTSKQQVASSTIEPERSSKIIDVVHPDRIERVVYQVHNQQPLSVPHPKPEEKIQLDWMATHPERVERPMFDASKQLTVPDPETVPVLRSIVYHYFDRPVRQQPEHFWIPFFEAPAPPAPPVPPAPPSPPEPNGGGSSATAGGGGGGGGYYGFAQSMWAPESRGQNINKGAFEPDEDSETSWSVEPMAGLPQAVEPKLFVRQSIYNFAADIPEETRGRVVTLLQEYENEDLFVRMSNVYRSYDRSLIAFQNKELATKRQVVVDIQFNSAEERDILTDIALKRGFFIESSDNKRLSLLAPEEKSIDASLLVTIKRYIEQKNQEDKKFFESLRHWLVKPAGAAVVEKSVGVVVEPKLVSEPPVYEMSLGAPELPPAPLTFHTKRRRNLVGWVAVAFVTGWLLGYVVKKQPDPEPKASKKAKRRRNK